MLTPPLSLTWADLVDRLVEERGSLAEVVRVLYEVHPGGLASDPSTVERGLRRLRGRATRPGDTYGRLLLRHFGLPADIVVWARALGTYHGPLLDLPMPLRREQLRLWDRPPLLESRHAAWIHLALASLAHGDGRLADTDRRLVLARLGARRAGPDAELELALFTARRRRDAGDDAAADELLASCPPLFDAVDEPHRSCFRARWLDQRAYGLSRDWRVHPEQLHRAAELLEQIDSGGVPFVAYRHHHGLAWVRWRQGDGARGATHARAAIEVAGDGGLLRLRAASLSLLARIEPGSAAVLRSRAAAILGRLD